MPELSHDAAEDGFHEIQLSGKQLVFLSGTAAAVLVITFLCGVLVGRNAQLNRGDSIDGTSTAPATPTTSSEVGPTAAEPPAPPADDELSYHRRLKGDAPPEQLKPKAEDRSAPAPAPPAAPRDTAPVDVPTSGKPGTWFVQVIALGNRGEAANLVKKLIQKGYPAYLELPPRGTPAIYRVRVGRYNDRREAEQAARRLKDDKLTADVRR